MVSSSSFDVHLPRCCQEYLSDAEFERLFEMPKSDFRGLQKWKRTKLKQALQIY